MSNKVDFSSFRCSHPVRVGHSLVPCGHCIACRSSRINEWSTRLSLENKTYKNQSIFCTLTYNQDNLHSPALVKSDLQKFFKRLRYYLKTYFNLSDLSYFACGEYGSLNYRPHFHFILFGVSYSRFIVNLISKVWNKGFVKVKPTVAKNFYYVAKYNVKTLNKSVLGVPEFTVMSRRQAIGSRYIIDNIDKIKESKFKVKIGKKEVFAPRSILRKKFKELYDNSRKKICNFILPDFYDIEKIKQDYFKYCLDCVRFNFFNRFSDYFEFRFLRPSDMKYIIDINCNREREFCTKHFKNRFRYYKDNELYFFSKNLMILNNNNIDCGYSSDKSIYNLYNPFYDAYYFQSFEFY